MTEQAQPHVGRPSEYTPEVAATICGRLAEGISLREICRADDMPGRTTVLRWLSEREEFRGQYAIAREAQADHMADEILEIADDASNDWMLRKQGEDEVQVLNSEHVNRSRLRVDSRKWLLSKLLPKKYGEKLETRTTISADDTIMALMQRIAENGRRIQDKPDE